MEFVFNGSHKSITQLPIASLPSFTVLTGLNGSGKTHFLEAISQEKLCIPGVTGQNGSIRLFDWMTFVPQESSGFSAAEATTERDYAWLTFNSARDEVMCQSLGDNAEETDAFLRILRNAGPLVGKTIERMVRREGFNLWTATETEFAAEYPRCLAVHDAFHCSFGRVFSFYQAKRIEHFAKCEVYRREERFDQRDCEIQLFEATWSAPPWDVVNELFRTAGLDFQVTSPTELQLSGYAPVLQHNNGATVRIGELSSGERILIALAICVFHSSDWIPVAGFPRVLLLDEIDATLHPKMARHLLAVIQDAFVRSLAIDVILTTHSPTTVALAPDESIHIMEGGFIRHVPKDVALAKLTIGVPTFSVDYENRRQVFVESKHDAKRYERLFSQLRDQLLPESSIHFISSGSSGSGSCNQVRKVVQDLVNGGNRSTFGIVDWDLSANEARNRRIKVLGQGNRYAIENYLLDPIVIAVILTRLDEGSRKRLSVLNATLLTELSKKSESDICGIASVILGELSKAVLESDDLELAELKQEMSSCEEIPCPYVNGMTILLPKWFRHCKKEILEKCYKAAFCELGQYRKDGSLANEACRMLVDEMPGFLSVDFCSLFKEIQQGPFPAD